MKIAALALLSVIGVAAVARAEEPQHASSASPVSVSPPDAALPAKSNVTEEAKPRAEASKPRQDATRRNDPPHGRTCFNSVETREKIATHRLTEPFRAMRVGRLQGGEVLRARLCRWKPDEFVYEISVLRPSGRISRIYMNARDGQSVGALDDNDRK